MPTDPASNPRRSSSLSTDWKRAVRGRENKKPEPPTAHARTTGVRICPYAPTP